MLVSGNVLLDDHQAPGIPEFLDALEADGRIGNAFAQQVIQCARKAGKHRLFRLAPLAGVRLELEAILLELAQPAPRNACAALYLGKVDGLQMEAVARFGYYGGSVPPLPEK